MDNIPFLIIPFITLIAFFVKGTTGFGTALIMVPINTLLIGVREAIVLSSILDMVGGIILYYNNPLRNNYRFWLPLAFGMVIGVILGGIVLTIVPVNGFGNLFGIVVFFLGLWFIIGRRWKDDSGLPHKLPVSCTSCDVSVSLLSGFCGGLFGISGPPIVYYLGKRLAKEAFRGTLIAVFMFSGIARFVTYLSTGLVNYRISSLALVSMPTVLIGLYAGTLLFNRIPEVWFSRFVGCVLIISAFYIVFR